MTKSQFTIGAFAIILDENHRVLLCHRRDKDMWNCPGGALEDSEAPWDAVVRETKEEVGLDVRVENLVGIYPMNNENDLVFSFICSIIGGEIQQSDEADDIRYFAIDELPENLHENHRERIFDIKKESSEVILRYLTGR